MRKWLIAVGVMVLALGLVAGWLAYNSTGRAGTGVLTLAKKSPGAATRPSEAGTTARPVAIKQAGGSTKPPEVPVSIAPASPASRFRESDYGKTRMAIYYEFRQAALEWTADDYFQQWDRRDALDGEQAYQVYVYLRTCLDTPRTAEQLQQRIEGLRWQHDNDPDSLGDEELSRRLDRYHAGAIRCEGLEALRGPLEPFLIDWLTRAADSGYAQAQLAYHQSIRWLLGRQQQLIYRQPERVHEYRQKARAHLSQVLSTGHAEAFIENAQALVEGIIVDRDPVLAYGHAHAADLASHGQNRQARNFLAVLEPELDPEQMREARELGRLICQAHCR